MAQHCKIVSFSSEDKPVLLPACTVAMAVSYASTGWGFNQNFQYCF